MWTPKRIVLLAAAFAFFLTDYAVYANFLGGIDGLPPLPEIYTEVGPEITRTLVHKGMQIEDKLVQSFGPDCEELKHPIRLELHSRRTVLAAGEFKIIKDGKQLLLMPISIALYGVERDGVVEINTLRANIAYLTFDRPISNLAEMGSRKIVAAELHGNIHVVNNHKTAARDDDLHIDVATGPLYYDDAKRLIWTNDEVRLTDYQSKPKPTRINGLGMQMDLTSDEAPPKPGSPPPRKAKGDSITGVRRIILKSGVHMDLYVDGQSGFMSGPSDSTTPKSPPKPKDGKTADPEKSHVVIKTPGPFQYDFLKDHDEARFDVPEDKVRAVPLYVTVERINVDGKTDTLDCKHLELKLRRKESPPPKAGVAPPAQPTDHGLDIETAHATGPDVTLVSNVENMDAHGNDFFYDAVRHLTTLKGTPQMSAVKDNSTIHARELQILDLTKVLPDGTTHAYRQITGVGPGVIDMYDDKPAAGAAPPPPGGLQERKTTLHAVWRDTLVSTKDGPHDLLILTGAAGFEDRERKQSLRADTLKVWLIPKEDQPTAAVGTQQARRPHHVEALGNVLGDSPEMHVHDTSRLVVWFKDAPHAAATPAAVKGAPVAGAAAPAGVTTPSGQPGDVAPALTAKGAPPAGPPKPEAAPRPIDLSARSVEARVLRSDEPSTSAVATPRAPGAVASPGEAKNTLEKLDCEGSVKVKQAPEKPGEEGVDITGDTLHMDYHPEGNYLVVNGVDEPAQLRLNNILIAGYDVNIDQASNRVWVRRAGFMTMKSKSSFEGAPLAEPVDLTVWWEEWMHFNGRNAEFHGSIQAEQDNAHLQCQVMQVYFDRPISLREGDKGNGPPPQVKKLVCDKDVHIEEKTIDKTASKPKLIKYQLLQSPWVMMESLEADDDAPSVAPPPPVKPVAPGAPPATAPNPGKEVTASGPGNLRIYQLGSDPNAPRTDPKAEAKPAPRVDDRAAAKPDPKAAPKTSEEMKMTFVSYNKSMWASSKSNRATFYENVQVLNFPCKDPYFKIDLDTILGNRKTMPPGMFYLKSDKLEVLNRPDKATGRSNQEMEATGKVRVESSDFYGAADKVFYNEAKDQIIFLGTEGNAALLARPKGLTNDKWDEMRGMKIIYIRRTGEANVEGGETIQGQK